MKKIDQIIYHPLFQSSMAKIDVMEEKRIFCCHGIAHSLDVARAAYITVLKEKLPFSQELVYGAALLHDIGRWREYEEGIPHERASEDLARRILADTDFDDGDQASILSAIRCHRSMEAAAQNSFAYILYQADKETRPCYLCGARDACYWPEERKNRTIID